MNNLNSANKEFKNILKKRNMLSDTMGDDISESWIRCITTGLNPFKDPKQRLISSIELKQIKEINHLALIKQSRLSVMPIDLKSWKIIYKMSKV